MKNTLETRLGIFFALALVAALVLLEMIGKHDILASGYIVKARFANIQELQQGDPVRMAGVQVGRVSQIKLAENKVEVTMKLDKGTEVRTDSKALIKFVGLMGQNYVSIDFGSSKAPIATAGALLQTTEQADLNSLMVKLESVADGVQGLTKNFSGENFSNLLGPFTDFLKENNPKLSEILTNIKLVSGQISQGKGTVGRVIMEDTLYASALTTVSNLDARLNEFKPLVDDAKLTLAQARDITAQINRGEGTAGKLIKDEALYRETTASMTNLKEILQKINQGQGSVGKLVNDESFLQNAKLTLQKVDKATEGLEDQGPLSVLGIAVQSLF